LSIFVGADLRVRPVWVRVLNRADTQVRPYAYTDLTHAPGVAGMRERSAQQRVEGQRD